MSRKKWAKHEFDILKRMASNGYRDKQIADKLGRSCNAIRSQRYKRGIELIKLNRKLYKTWTNKNVWALGLLTADGSFNKKTKRNSFGVYNTDLNLVKEFKNIFGTKNKITEVKSDRLGEKKVWRIFMSSKYLINFFKKINAYGKKDVRNPLDSIPDEFKWAFIKGLFDGDGNIYNGTFSIAGREELIKHVYFWICSQINKKPNKIYTSTNSNKTKYFQIAPSDSINVLKLISKHTKGTYNSGKFKKWRNYFAEELQCAIW